MQEEYPLHDATFDGIILSGRAATLYFTTASNEGCEVTLHYIDALQMDEFRNGNIVVYFGVIQNERLTKSEQMGRLYSPPHASASNEYHSQYQAMLETKVAAIEGGEMSLIEMEPAIGAALLATCEKVTMVQR